MRNKYRIADGCAHIELRRKDGNNLETKVDLDDLEKLKGMKIRLYALWNPKIKSFYAVGWTTACKTEDRKFFYLHRLLTDAPEGTHVDHIHHDTLDNRRSEIRVVTPKENMNNLKKPMAESKNNVSYGKGYYKLPKCESYYVRIVCKDLSLKTCVKTEAEAIDLVAETRQKLKEIRAAAN